MPAPEVNNAASTALSNEEESSVAAPAPSCADARSSESLPKLEEQPLEALAPHARSAEKQAELEADLDDLFSSLGVQRGKALEEAMTPKLAIPLHPGLRPAVGQPHSK